MELESPTLRQNSFASPQIIQYKKTDDLAQHRYALAVVEVEVVPPSQY